MSEEIENCPICHDRPVDAVSLRTCNHILCASCFSQLQLSQSQINEEFTYCPLCRQAISESEPNEEVRAKIQEEIGTRAYIERLSAGFAEFYEATVPENGQNRETDNDDPYNETDNDEQTDNDDSDNDIEFGGPAFNAFNLNLRMGNRPLLSLNMAFDRIAQMAALNDINELNQHSNAVTAAGRALILLTHFIWLIRVCLFILICSIAITRPHYFEVALVTIICLQLTSSYLKFANGARTTVNHGVGPVDHGVGAIGQ